MSLDKLFLTETVITFCTQEMVKPHKSPLSLNIYNWSSPSFSLGNLDDCTIMHYQSSRGTPCVFDSLFLSHLILEGMVLWETGYSDHRNLLLESKQIKLTGRKFHFKRIRWQSTITYTSIKKKITYRMPGHILSPTLDFIIMIHGEKQS